MLHVFYKGNSTMSEEFSVDAAEWQLEEVRLHLSANGGSSENFAITLISGEGDEYNVELSASDMNADDDVQYKPTRPDTFLKADKLAFTYTNTNDQAWGLEIIYSIIR